MKKMTCLAAVAALGAIALEAKVELGVPFADHAVLQRGREVPVWGTADPGAKVKVSFAGMTREATAGVDGAWCVNVSMSDHKTSYGKYFADTWATDKDGKRVFLCNTSQITEWISILHPWDMMTLMCTNSSQKAIPREYFSSKAAV